MSHYSIRVAWSEEDGMFAAVCPELGDLSALGSSQHEAVCELEQAIELALETYESKGWPLPEPAEVEEYSGQFRLRLPRSLHAWLAQEAERQGVSLNTLAASLLSQARGSTESQVVITDQILLALDDLKASLPSSVRSAMVSAAADTSFSWEAVIPPDYGRYQDARTDTLSLITKVG